jgi:hypothetical protein
VLWTWRYGIRLPSKSREMEPEETGRRDPDLGLEQLQVEQPPAGLPEERILAEELSSGEAQAGLMGPCLWSHLAWAEPTPVSRDAVGVVKTQFCFQPLVAVCCCQP